MEVKMPIKALLLLFLLATSSLAASRSGEWTETDSLGACHFLTAQNLKAQGVALIDNSNFFINSKTVASVVKIYESTLLESKKVSNATLTKMHPALSDKYESEFRRSLELSIHGFNSNESKLLIQSTFLYNQFASWANVERGNFAIPKGVIASCRKS
jgi:hypothetical protein